MYRHAAWVVSIWMISGLALGSGASLEAQSQGRISGKVLDVEGNPLRDVVITLEADDRAFNADATTNKKGKFVLTLLDSTWSYTIRIEKDGFAPIEEPIKPVVGGITNVSWTLAPAQPGQSDGKGGGDGLSLEAGVDGPRPVVKAYEAGAKAFAEGDFAGAVEKFKQALELSPELTEGYHALAMAYYNLEQPEDALAMADRFAELGEANSFDIELIRYDSLVSLERLEEAGPVLEQLVVSHPGEAAGRRAFNLGVRYYKEKNNDLAIEWMTRATAADPNLQQAHRVLAQILAAGGRYEESLVHAEHALGLDSEDPDGLLVRFEALRGLGRESEGEDSLDRLKTSNPDKYVVTFMRVGLAEFELGQNEAAIRSFKRVLDAQPDHPHGNYRLGVTLISAGDTENGRKHLERFMALSPDDPEVAAAKEMLSYLE